MDNPQATGVYWATQSETHDSSQALPFCCTPQTSHPFARDPSVHPPSLHSQKVLRASPCRSLFAPIPGPPTHTFLFLGRVLALAESLPHPSLIPPHSRPPDTPFSGRP